MSTANQVPKVYRIVIEEVIKNVKEAFLNEGVDEQVLQELKQIWENKLLQSRAVDGIPTENQQPTRQQFMYPHIVQSNPGITTATITRQPQPHQQQQQHHHQQPQQRVAISHAVPSTVIPSAITAQPPASAQTAIIFPDSAQARPAQSQTHMRALSQMTSAAATATLALPGMQQVQRPSGSGLPTAYPTARTIQVTQAHHQQLQQQQQQQQQQHQQQQHQQQQQQPGQQQGVTTQVQQNKPPHMIIQVDGANDSDSDDGDDDDLGDDEDHDRNTGQEFDEQDAAEEDEPLNTDDDDSDDNATDLFDTENVVVCQFEKINRSRNKWKFHLKDGIMNVKGKDYIFHKATGEAEW